MERAGSSAGSGPIPTSPRPKSWRISKPGHQGNRPSRKNSLSLVSALLNLQAQKSGETSRAVLRDAASRVHAVATVHDQLFRQRDAREIDPEPFLSNLAGALGTTGPKHGTVVNVEPATITADAAIPVGLFVNELITKVRKERCGFTESVLIAINTVCKSGTGVSVFRVISI